MRNNLKDFNSVKCAKKNNQMAINLVPFAFLSDMEGNLH